MILISNETVKFNEKLEPENKIIIQEKEKLFTDFELEIKFLKNISKIKKKT